MVYGYQLADSPEEKRKMLKELIIIKEKLLKEREKELIKLQKEYLELKKIND